MARTIYGGTSGDYAVAPGGRIVPGATYEAYTAKAGGSRITDLLDADGNATSVVTASSTGLIYYSGPDDGSKDPHWLQPTAGGERTAVVPLDNIGETGATPALSIGTVTTGTAGATLSGTAEEPVLSLVLPSAGANGVNTAAIQDGAVTSAKLAAAAVTAAKIANDTITATQIAANAVGSSELADNAVDTAAIADSAVTSAKIAGGTIVDADISAGAAIAQSKVANLTTDLAAKATLATVGNLLTANVATGTDTLGDTTGFTASGATLASSTDVAFRGGRSLKVTATAAGTSCRVFAGGTTTSGTIPVQGGAPHTVSFRARAAAGLTGRQITWVMYWWTAAGNVAASTATSTAAGQALANDGWTEFTAVVTPPADAAFASLRISGVSGVLEIGDEFYVDTVGFWLGAGGLWVPPGVPVPNLGTRADPANSAQVQVWNPGNNTWITV